MSARAHSYKWVGRGIGQSAKRGFIAQGLWRVFRSERGRDKCLRLGDERELIDLWWVVAIRSAMAGFGF
ncbi:hypothetical protein HAL013_07010 [Helicobacter ailurogastricus]|uniref:Uncharacterized protein n=1 Tax=Helicobacter ailurogastricus TaxID=1578720 RepID=A0A0K2XAC5_9HELI|nr:hypothetical protein HAL013_07010 [Helicobacter ailurogastricus]CRF44181.1 hypothetical protein HAL09_07540 [Helicobacter ailurogastricus]